jgi:hypothetical protein
MLTKVQFPMFSCENQSPWSWTNPPTSTERNYPDWNSTAVARRYRSTTRASGRSFVFTCGDFCQFWRPWRSVSAWSTYTTAYTSKSINWLWWGMIGVTHYPCKTYGWSSGTKHVKTSTELLNSLRLRNGTASWWGAIAQNKIKVSIPAPKSIFPAPARMSWRSLAANKWCP